MDGSGSAASVGDAGSGSGDAGSSDAGVGGSEAVMKPLPAAVTAAVPLAALEEMSRAWASPRCR